jgi:hypothetical protein
MNHRIIQPDSKAALYSVDSTSDETAIYRLMRSIEHAMVRGDLMLAARWHIWATFDLSANNATATRLQFSAWLNGINYALNATANARWRLACDTATGERRKRKEVAA